MIANSYGISITTATKVLKVYAKENDLELIAVAKTPQQRVSDKVDVAEMYKMRQSGMRHSDIARGDKEEWFRFDGLYDEVIKNMKKFMGTKDA